MIWKCEYHICLITFKFIEEKPATTSVKVHHTPGGGSSLVLGGDTPEEPAKTEDVKAEQTEAEGDAEEAKEETPATTEAAAAGASGIVPGVEADGSSQPHTSVSHSDCRISKLQNSLSLQNTLLQLVFYPINSAEEIRILIFLYIL